MSGWVRSDLVNEKETNDTHGQSQINRVIVARLFHKRFFGIEAIVQKEGLQQTISVVTIHFPRRAFRSPGGTSLQLGCRFRSRCRFVTLVTRALKPIGTHVAHSLPSPPEI